MGHFEATAVKKVHYGVHMYLLNDRLFVAAIIEANECAMYSFFFFFFSTSGDAQRVSAQNLFK